MNGQASAKSASMFSVSFAGSRVKGDGSRKMLSAGKLLSWRQHEHVRFRTETSDVNKLS